MHLTRLSQNPYDIWIDFAVLLSTYFISLNMFELLMNPNHSIQLTKYLTSSSKGPLGDEVTRNYHTLPGSMALTPATTNKTPLNAGPLLPCKCRGREAMSEHGWSKCKWPENAMVVTLKLATHQSKCSCSYGKHITFLHPSTNKSTIVAQQWSTMTTHSITWKCRFLDWNLHETKGSRRYVDTGPHPTEKEFSSCWNLGQKERKMALLTWPLFAQDVSRRCRYGATTPYQVAVAPVFQATSHPLPPRNQKLFVLDGSIHVDVYAREPLFLSRKKGGRASLVHEILHQLGTMMYMTIACYAYHSVENEHQKIS